MTENEKTLVRLALEVVKETHGREMTPAVKRLHEFYYTMMPSMEWFDVELEGLKDAKVRAN